MPRFSRTVLLCLAVASALPATTVSYNPAPTTSVGYNPCGNYPGYGCKTLAYFDAQSLDSQNGNSVASLFENAFDAWNAGGTWTIASVKDPGGTFNVDTATAQQFFDVTFGGLTIDIKLDGLNIPTLGLGDFLVWVQGLNLNYVPGTAGGTVAPYYALDTSTLSGLTCGGAISCPPAYPYQYADNSFYDQPKALYEPPGTTQAFFDADAYLAIENSRKMTLKLLDGVSYGFQNYVADPEPGTWLLFPGGGLFLLGVWRRRQAD